MKNPNRRAFLGTLSASTLAAATAANAAPGGHRPILAFNCDLNWARWPKGGQYPNGHVRPSLPQDWAEVDAKAYWDYHVEFGNTVTYCQAYCQSGYSLYPSKLGPVGKGKAAMLFPDLYKLSREAGMPFWAYLNCNSDLFVSKEHPEWVIPGTVGKSYGHGGFIGPETPYVDLICRRIEEFLAQWPADWLLLDWFNYGPLQPNGGPVQPAKFVKKPFQRIIGRQMPSKAEEITKEENLLYKRTVLAEEFGKLQTAVKSTSPETKLIFNTPYYHRDEALWAGHPMMEESDGLFAESSDDVVGWLLDVRKPNQRVMTTIIGRSGGLSNPNTWKKWYDRGCDFFGYAWGTPPSFVPTSHYDEELEITRKAFQTMNQTK